MRRQLSIVSETVVQTISLLFFNIFLNIGSYLSKLRVQLGFLIFGALPLLTYIIEIKVMLLSVAKVECCF